MNTYKFPRATASIALIASAALFLVACATGTNEGTSEETNVSVPSTVTSTAEPAPGTTSETTTTESASPTTTTNENGALGNPDLGKKERRASGESGLTVADVRIAAHDNFDRVVFDLEGEGEPGWYIDYTTQPAQQGSGHPVDYEGEIALHVAIEGTPYPFDLPGQPDSSEIGTVQGAGHVTAVEWVSLFEARTEFVIGMTEELPYSVTYLDDPKRLVIDFSTV